MNSSQSRAKPTFKASDLKRAIAVFQDMGLSVGGARITPDGAIEVLTGELRPALTSADPLADWERKHGKAA